MRATRTCTDTQPAAADEVVELLSELIRINTSNPTHPERPAAEWVAEKLAEVGIDVADLRIRARPGVDRRPHRRAATAAGRRC